jgi:hypothetical protein
MLCHLDLFWACLGAIYVGPNRAILAILGHFGPIVPILWQCWTYVGPIFGSLADLTTFSKTLKKYDSRANMPPTQAKAYSNSYCNCFSLMRARKKAPQHLQRGRIFPWAEVLLFFFCLHLFACLWGWSDLAGRVPWLTSIELSFVSALQLAWFPFGTEVCCSYDRNSSGSRH